MSDKQPAALDVRLTKNTGWQGLSLVWIVPIAALVVSLWATWQNYADRGTLITISFENTAGVTAGETRIKFRDVVVGEVEGVEFSEGLSEVLVHARIDKSVAPYLDDDAQFWIVRPDVSVRGITGLETVLSGVFIEGNWDTVAGVTQSNFKGLERPNLTRASQKGVRVVLRAEDGGSIAAGAPVLHKGIEVGYLETPELSQDGSHVIVNAFIESPFDRWITSSTRFWDTSGFSISLGAGGIALDVNSLASLIEGGIAFDTLVSGGQPIEDGDSFDIFANQQSARNSLFVDPNAELLKVAVLFDESVSGLTVGSEVRFQGIRIGKVSELRAIIVGEEESTRAQLQVVLAIEPSRLGLSSDASIAEATELLAGFVERGLRARMVTGNILAGTLMVELITVDEASAARLDIVSGGYPVIPTTESKISDVAVTAEGVLARINNLPIEELMEGAIDLMDSVERLANNASTQAAPESLVALANETRQLVASDDVQSIPRDLRKVIGDLNLMVSEASQAGLITNLGQAIDTARIAANNIELATRNLPQITQQIEALTLKANRLELDALVTYASSTLASIDRFIGSDDVTALPSGLNAAMEEMRGFLAEVNRGDAIENLNGALASANKAAVALETAVTSLPALSARANGLVAKTEAVIESYGERSRFNAQTLKTLQDIQAAAEAVSSLSRSIQRNPNSIIIGR